MVLLVRAEPTPPSAIQSFLSTCGEIVTAVIDWLGDMLAFVVGNPVILVPLLMFFIVGGVVGILMRILRG